MEKQGRETAQESFTIAETFASLSFLLNLKAWHKAVPLTVF